jgi:hypothetical protein
LLASCASRGPAPIAGAEAAEDCPVTLSPDQAFIPPEPWPSAPPDQDRFWFGSAGLWTALPNDGEWRQLALGEKFWWWSESYSASDVRQDGNPDLTVTARRVGETEPSFETSEATNGFHESFHQAMLTGVELPSPGCWQFEAEFDGATLSFIVWVPEAD